MMQKKNISKILKILGITLGTFFVLVLMALGIVFYHLPSAKQLGSYFKKDQPMVQKKNQTSYGPKALGLSASSDVSVAEGAQHNDSPSEVTPRTQDRAKSIEELKEFLDERSPAITFCNKLNQAKSGPIEVLAPSPPSESSVHSNDLGGDLRIEAIKPFFKTILRQPEMSKLLSMVLENEEFMNHPEAAEDGLFNKAIFYKQAYQAYSEIKENLPEYESIVDRTYLMYKLNDLIVFKPELQNDPRIMKFCEESEHEFNTYSPVNYANEKQIFERLIQEVGVDPQAIKYDPNYKTSLKLDFSENNLQLGGGWLNELMPDASQDSARQ